MNSRDTTFKTFLYLLGSICLVVLIIFMGTISKQQSEAQTLSTHNTIIMFDKHHASAFTVSERDWEYFVTEHQCKETGTYSNETLQANGIADDGEVTENITISTADKASWVCKDGILIVYH